VAARARSRRSPAARPDGARSTAAADGARAVRRLVVAPDAAARLAAATAWLAALPADAEALVVAPTWEAVDELARADAGGRGARFGLARTTLARLAASLAAPGLAESGKVPASGLSLAAVAARAVHRLAHAGRLRHYAPVAQWPGFPHAAARTLEELAMHAVPVAAFAGLGRAGADLATLRAAVDEELAAAGLVERSAVYATAAAALEADPAPDPAGRPLLLLDLPAPTAREAALLAALARRAPTVLATVPAGDPRAEERLGAALGAGVEHLPSFTPGGSLAALQTHLFVEASAPPPADLDESVALRSWPGEARECVEIARAIQAEAAKGTPFDRMAVVLHAPPIYTAHLEEALGRAAIPAFFARGTTRPRPAGRALLALLACAAERLSARRFAEYLSLGQVPDAATADAFVPPADDLAAAPPLAPAPEEPPAEPVPDPDARTILAGTVRAPWRWERLLVDAAVIGGADRWRTRLAGLENELLARRAALDDADEARSAALDRLLLDLRHLRAFALPLVERLDALPGSAPWREWLEALGALAATALREPAPVVAVLSELAPMGPVGPVQIDEVQLVLAPRLRDVTEPPPRRRYGAVFVASPEAMRGLAFDVVFVPGLAESLFPGKIIEDPILRDTAREKLDAPTLDTQGVRVERERLALRLAVGAARRRAVLSYPRLDVERARARVPSFYALEALRAAEGRLPGFDELGIRAERESGGRLGWPAPERPEDAIDEAEYDLALLTPLLTATPELGAAHYLLGANPHLGRALRARARRWLSRWTPADGLVDAGPLAAEALAGHQLAARSYSPTALQHYASCPYRFFLQAIHRLAPREEPVAVERLDPLTRGGLVHDAQFETLTRLRADGMLPLGSAAIEAALKVLDDALDGVARAYREQLAPAIPRVWDDAITAVRADLREWLRRLARADDGWVPERFELAFGLAGRERTHEDPASVPDPVRVLDGRLGLRGSIDLVERHTSGMRRATDYKTGKVWAPDGAIVKGGTVLQPVLYALALETLLGPPVSAGRLYYCTADGGYTERIVPLDATARDEARTVVETIGAALAEGFLPAAPAPRACALCDYRPVCGPHEQTRTARKPAARVAALKRLRELP
jgi:CRISPR/Cas system-associated exonuclease Cas4 (RecB family)